MKPGDVVYFTYAALWSRATSGDNLASVALLKKESDLVQTVFNSCFNLVTDAIAPANKNLGVQVSPNPAEGQDVHFKFPGPQLGSLKIYNLQGKQMLNIISQGANYVLEKDVLKPGLYIYQYQGKGQSTTGKLIIK